jgi:uncharacterized protein (TIRG00374 family)
MTEDLQFAEKFLRGKTKSFLIVLLVGLIGLSVYLVLFLGQDFTVFITSFWQVQPAYYALAVVSVIADTVMFTLAWHFLLKGISVRIPRLRALAYTWISSFVDTLIPGESISADLVKIYFVNKEHVGSSGKVTASLALQRVFGVVIILFSFPVGLLLFAAEGRSLTSIMGETVLVFTILTIVGLAAFLLLCRKKSLLTRLMERAFRLVSRVVKDQQRVNDWRVKVTDILDGFYEALTEFARMPRTLSLSFCLQVVSWVFSLLIMYLVSLSVGAVISWSVIILCLTIFTILKGVPIGVPFEAGIPEITLSALLMGFGIPVHVSIAVTLLTRLLTTWLRFFVGLGCAQWYVRARWRGLT